MIKYVNVCLDPQALLEKMVKLEPELKNDKLVSKHKDINMAYNFQIALSLSVICYDIIILTCYDGDPIFYGSFIAILSYCLIRALWQKIKYKKICSLHRGMVFAAEQLEKFVKEQVTFEDVIHDPRFALINNITAILWLIYNTQILSIQQDGNTVTVVSELDGVKLNSTFKGCIVKEEGDCNTLSVTRDFIILANYDGVLKHAIKSLVVEHPLQNETNNTRISYITDKGEEKAISEKE